MNKWYVRVIYVLSLCMLLCGCGPERTDIECDSTLVELIPEANLFSKGSFISTPDTGVSVESQAKPSAVCHINYEIPGGSGAILNLYKFNSHERASIGFHNLRQQSTKINPEFDEYVNQPSVSSEEINADDICISCSRREGRKICTVVAQYGSYIYWLDLIQVSDSAFIESNLNRILSILDDDFEDFIH